MQSCLTGAVLRDAVISGAAQISNHRQAVDELNVFPVPDGDTGTNMSMTINNAARTLAHFEDDSVERVAKETASALLRGARGNSGVILSLLFRGLSKGFKTLATADGVQLAAAFQLGVDNAYKAVMKPTEGTILTVARLAAQAAQKTAKEHNDVTAVLESAYAAGQEALAQTPELLPVLKKAGVVDAGGRGLLYILEGMISVVRDGVIISGGTQAAPQEQAEAVPFTYAVSCTVLRDPSAQKDPISLRAYLETVGGALQMDVHADRITLSLETDDPVGPLQEGLKFGQLADVSIQNRSAQSKQEQAEQHPVPATTEEGETLTPAAPEKTYGFVAVAAGDGLCDLFRELGADHVVQGGQTMNPSTDDILRAIEATPAKTVFVLPNNKNIIMAAEQTVPLASRKVCVLPTRTVPQGISALLAFDEDRATEENLIDMTAAAEHTATGQITYAARDSVFDGKEIKQGETLGILEGKVAFVEQDIIRAVGRLTKAMVHKDACQITLIYGQDVDEDTAAQAAAACEARAGDAEVAVINGGQPVYYFLISVE